MSTIGVHLTVTITIFCLFFLYFILSKKKFSKKTFIIAALFLFSFYTNSDTVLKSFNIIKSNKYHTIQIREGTKGGRLLLLNNAAAAGYSYDQKTLFPYMNYIEENYIDPIKANGPVRSILAMGSGGFTLGLNDNKNDYIFVDIDGDLKDISEQYFLKRKLGENKKFNALPARGYLQQAANKNKKFDFIFIDTYLGMHLPEHLVTKEFFESVKNRLNDNGIVAINLIASPTFNNAFSTNMDNTLKTVFPTITRQIIGSKFNAWNTNPTSKGNIIYSYFHKNYDKNIGIYTDDKNRIYYDKYKPISDTPQ